ncbi:hypothetical protein [Lysinibacillus fusiformis]|uniref:hypothetical protein n=1 Tax=Lysinibacillus fusiformis TaxID=28031 RepID=UPI003CEA1F2B
MTKNNKTGIDPIEDFDYRIVKAGEEFNLTLYEFMYLIIRDEYNGRLSVNGKDFYAYLSVKAHAYGEVYKLKDNEENVKNSGIQSSKDKRTNLLPTPTIIFEKDNGSSRENMVDIDVRNEEGEWFIKEEEYKRFEPLLNRRKKNKRSKIVTVSEETEK